LDEACAKFPIPRRDLLTKTRELDEVEPFRRARCAPQDELGGVLQREVTAARDFKIRSSSLRSKGAEVVGLRYPKPNTSRTVAGYLAEVGLEIRRNSPPSADLSAI
jgi:hypothetical protein